MTREAPLAAWFAGIQCRRGRRKRRSLTRPAKKAMPAEDLIGRNFTVIAPGEKLVGDIPYIPADEGWLYLATWLELATREIVGYSMAGRHRAFLVVDVLGMAVGRGRLKPGCIAHSDRGSEYEPTPTGCRGTLEYALASREVEVGWLIHHADHGRQYTSIYLTTRLMRVRVQASIGSGGDRTTMLSRKTCEC
ncbi:DDE-type integrase/transposase/recombinase [Streptomyces collinus]|uniref:DDE-type integrase/transposase/recombinase n=1 Tax=Streptomyces collinus TaxID=42684 RepID=UPI00378E96B4